MKQLDILLAALYGAARELEANNAKSPKRFVLPMFSTEQRQALESEMILHLQELIGGKLIQHAQLEASTRNISHFNFPSQGLEIVLVDCPLTKTETKERK